MIILESVSVGYSTRGGWLDVLSGVSARFDPGLNIGIIGLKGCGKTTLLRLLGAHIQPSMGTVKRSGKVSWPITSLRPLAKTLSLRNNIQFLSSIYDVPIGPLMRRVADLSELHGYLDIKAERLPHHIVVQATYAICLAMNFDYYLADESLFVGDEEFRQKANSYLDAMRGQRTLIFASRNARLIQRHCDIAYILHEGRLSRYDDPNQAAAALKAL